MSNFAAGQLQVTSKGFNQFNQSQCKMYIHKMMMSFSMTVFKMVGQHGGAHETAPAPMYF